MKANKKLFKAIEKKLFGNLNLSEKEKEGLDKETTQMFTLYKKYGKEFSKLVFDYVSKKKIPPIVFSLWVGDILEMLKTRDPLLGMLSKVSSTITDKELRYIG